MHDNPDSRDDRRTESGRETNQAIRENLKEIATSNGNCESPLAKKVEEKLLRPWRFFTLIVSATLTAFLVFLDSSIIVTAIPHITSQFHSVHDVGWYGSAYLLSNCALQPLNGKLYARFALKYNFLSFLGVFELGSLICALANSSSMLIGGRVVAGFGAAGLLTGVLALITASTPKDRRPAVFGLVLSLSQLGTVFGPLIGGSLTQLATWRWCFYINLPAGAIVAASLILVKPPEQNLGMQCKTTIVATLKSLDLLGATLFGTSTVMFLLAVQMGGQTRPWGSATVIGLLMGSALDFVIFVAWQYRRGNAALIPLSPLHQRVLYSSCLNMFFIMGNLIVTIYYFPIWFQVVKNSSPIESGVNLLPMIVPQIVFSVLAGGLVGRFRRYLPPAVICGMFLSIGTGLFTTVRPDTTKWRWAGFQILIGVGRGCGFQIPLNAVQNALPPAQAAIGTSLVLFCQYFGGALFSAVGEAILVSKLKDYLPVLAPGVDTPTVIYAGASGTGIRQVTPKILWRGVMAAYNQALSHVFYLATAGGIAAFLTCFGMENISTTLSMKQDMSKEQEAKASVV